MWINILKMTHISHIDLNSDLGEGFGSWGMGDDEAMLSLVTSANIACGGHAGDAETMYKTLKLAKEKNVTIGAHPGFADKEGFGRRLIPMQGDEIAHIVITQIGALYAMARYVGVKLAYVKTHGALANLAAKNRKVADAITFAIHKFDADLPILAISGTEVEKSARSISHPVYSEIFADRGYLSSGQLVPREQKGAMIEECEEAASRLLHFLKTGLMPTVEGDEIPLKADSICIHGDSPKAVEMARYIRAKFDDAGVVVKPFCNAV